MSEFLTIGAYFGAAVGLVHAGQIITARLRTDLGLPSTAWLALVFWALWTVFGAYVVALWVIGLVLMIVGRALRVRRLQT